jgi:hypothetical protein
MGLCASGPAANLTPEEQEKLRLEKQNNTQLGKSMAAEKIVDGQLHKLLLLGAGESGKNNNNFTRKTPSVLL